MQLPARKRTKPMTDDEKQYYIQTQGKELFEHNFQKYGDIEIDIPAFDRLEKDIEQRFERINNKLLENYKHFLKYVDQINLIFSKYIPCKRGCCKCCYFPVNISDIEINIIKKYLYDIKQNVNYKNLNNSKKYNNNNKCPFLKNSECIIYPVRPFMCRKYIVFNDDNSLCNIIDNKPINQSFNSYIINKIYENIIVKYCKKKNIELKPYDIKDIFEEI
jgi:Fe-S-cluster containining protein